mmetsp:Transcript_115668/g.327048  ORF Transcript_115668/g.327048 Transcript_115668/m.327048 type:complete len:325 (-) Transcript_115668:130-1104(-)|eukprot:CAMPEP_0117516428 /NCGR_PEP_ID=MMETSP0784-20121206/31090_1 /TAXON_ID=39447 /ORGANISM="" /LENGTH=324 /DNA_ID=CAMNT_0005312275 /DNA_START=78 /DNA_END=1052 /DNA_ORIENTATION=+
MPSRFTSVEAERAMEIKEALKAAGCELEDGDVVCYSVAKKENVSGKKLVAVLADGVLTEGDGARKLVGLPPSGCEDAIIKPDDVPVGTTCFVQSTSHNRKVPEGSHVLLLHAASEECAAAKRKAPADGDPPSKRHAAAADGIGDATVKARVADLLTQFKRFGEVGKPASASTIPKDVPPETREMLLAADEWHIEKGSAGVFGLNFFAKGNFIPKVELFGDQELLEEWAKKHTKPNCGEEAWKCIAAVSEFAFIFVNVDAASEDFGSTRIIQNNTFDDRPLAPAPFSNFLDKIDAFVKKYVKHREETGDDWEDDSPQFSNEVNWR